VKDATMDPFASLGLPPRFDLDVSELEKRYRELQRQFHPDRHTTAASPQRRQTLLKAMEVNEAYRTLGDDVSRAEVLMARLGGSNQEARTADPAFLMEVMELREGLSDARAEGDSGRVAAMAKEVAAKQQAVLSALATAFSHALAQEVSATELQQIAALVSKLKYYRRFLDEVAAIEDALLS